MGRRLPTHRHPLRVLSLNHLELMRPYLRHQRRQAGISLPAGRMSTFAQTETPGLPSEAQKKVRKAVTRFTRAINSNGQLRTLT